MTQVGKIDAGKRMKELENRQFPSQNAASQPELVHKELVGKRKVMTSELYEAVEKGDVENSECVTEGEHPSMLFFIKLPAQVIHCFMWQQIIRGEKGSRS